MLWVKPRKMITPTFDCTASAAEKAKMLRLPLEKPELKRELATPSKDYVVTFTTLPCGCGPAEHVQCHESDQNIEDSAILPPTPPPAKRRCTPKNLFPDVAKDQISNSYEEAAGMLSIGDCRQMLSQNFPQFDCVCESCNVEFESWDADFILCPNCEDEFSK